MGKFGVDVVEQLQVRSAEVAAQPGRRCGIGRPHAHVGGEDASEDLAHELRTRGCRDGHARRRVPQVVHPEGHLDHGLQGGHHRRHGGG